MKTFTCFILGGRYEIVHHNVKLVCVQLIQNGFAPFKSTYDRIWFTVNKDVTVDFIGIGTGNTEYAVRQMRGRSRTIYVPLVQSALMKRFAPQVGILDVGVFTIENKKIIFESEKSEKFEISSSLMKDPEENVPEKD